MYRIGVDLGGSGGQQFQRLAHDHFHRMGEDGVFQNVFGLVDDLLHVGIGLAHEHGGYSGQAGHIHSKHNRNAGGFVAQTVRQQGHIAFTV